MKYQYNQTLNELKKRRESMQNSISSIRTKDTDEKNANGKYFLRYIFTEEKFVEYNEKILKCIQNNKNILVPILLLDLTEEKYESSIYDMILKKDQLSARLKLHENMLFISTEKKYTEHFEPHGVSGEYNIPVEGVRQTLKRAVKKLGNSLCAS